jgi:serine protease Do
MRTDCRDGLIPVPGWPKFLLAAALAVAMTSTAPAQSPTTEELLSGIVRVKTFINPDGRTVRNLGQQRHGSGIVIDADGLVLTIGYLMVEAHTAELITNDGRTVPADVIGYDNDTGFGLLKALTPLKVRPLAIGKSAELKDHDRVLAASFGGKRGVAPAVVVARREFAGNWEYLVSDAIFTAPAHNEWSGAALINSDGKLVGVGSLIVGDATGKGTGVPGNMYVPIDLLPPILADLMSGGRSQGQPRPWIGINTEEVRGRLFVTRVTQDGPAEKAGLKRGDLIMSINGETPKNLADFYRKIWALGTAGTVVPLEVLQGNEKQRIEVKSMNRLDHLKLKSTF